MVNKQQKLPPGCIHIQNGKRCGAKVLELVGNGYLCWYHAAQVFPKPTEAVNIRVVK